MLQGGIIMGWVAPNIPKLTADDSPIKLNNEQVSWTASLISLGGFFGGIIGSLFNELLGSRKSIIAILVLISVNWICMIAANSVVWLYIGRTIAGIGMVSTYSVFSIYLGEVSDPKIRGTLVSIAMIGNIFGTMLGTIVETYLPINASSTFYLIICLFTLTFFFWLMDSPYYLVRINDCDRAEKSIRFYDSSFNVNVEKSLEEIKQFVRASLKDRNFGDKLRDLRSPLVKKLLLHIMTLFAIPHLSGIMNITTYPDVILKNSKSKLIDPKFFIILTNFVCTLINFSTFFLIDKLGRRILYIISSIGTTLALIGLGLHFLLLKYENNQIAQTNIIFQWLPFICILGYQIFHSIGYLIVPSVMLSEIFADNMKSMASMAATLTSSVIAFLVVKIYLTSVELIGETFVFWIHAAFSSIAIPYVLFFLPETKGLSFQQIQDKLAS